MKNFFIFIMIGLLAFFANSELSYEELFKKIFDKAKELENVLEAKALDFSNYDKWYKDFKEISSNFVESFIRTHKKKETFKLTKEAIDSFSLAWGFLSQADYAEKEYTESISLGKIEDASKWKNSSIEKRKKAIEEIKKAIELLKNAQSILED